MTGDHGLDWLANGGWSNCLVFARGVSEDQVFRAFGADPAEAVPWAPGDRELPGSGPMIRVGRSGEWIVAVQEDAELPQGIRPEVLRRLSAGGGEAVALHEDIGKLNHQFAHAADGVVITALTTSVPPHWRGSQPDRLEPVARILGLTQDSEEDGFTEWEGVVAMAESVFGLTLDRSDLYRPLPCVRVLPPLEDLGMRPAGEQVFRTGDPVIDLLMDHASPETLTTVVITRIRRLMTETGLNSYPELVTAADAAVSGSLRPPEDDELAGVALRRIARDQAEADYCLTNAPNGIRLPAPEPELRQRVRRGETARLLRLLLDSRPPGQLLASELWHQQVWDAKGWQKPLSWRPRMIADFGDVQLPNDELRAAEHAWLAVPEPVRGRWGMIDAEPVRAHVRALIDAGMEPTRISELARSTPVYIDLLLRGGVKLVNVAEAKRLLEIPLPE